MPKITISDLQTAHSENFLFDLSDSDFISLYGGEDDAFNQILNYGLKTLEFGLLAYATYSITLLASSFKPQQSILYTGTSVDGLSI